MWRSLPILLCSVFGFAQQQPDTTPAPAFDVVSIKPASAPGSRAELSVSQGRLTWLRAGTADLVAKAYNLRGFQVILPAGSGDGRWDIVATLPEGTSQQDIPVMLRSVLRERFHLRFHPDSQEIHVYALNVATGGPKMPELGADEAGTMRPSVSPSGKMRISGKIPLQPMVEFLTARLDKPVIDRTQLGAVYQINLEWSPTQWENGYRPPRRGEPGDPIPGLSLFDALRTTLGLELKPTKAAIPVVVVDFVERSPTEN